VLAAAFLGMAFVAWAQISVRPQDPLGLSIRQQRVRVLHSSRPDVPGTSMHLQQSDPWLAYQRGHSYFFHEWSRADGVFAALPTTQKVAAATTSCGMCHNQPFRTPGSGGNTVQPVGYGLNTPHLFGGGLVEMIAMQVRAEILAAFDRNRNGFLDVPSETAGRRALIEASPGTTVDFGSLDDLDHDGMPDLNRVIQVQPVDADGRALPRGSPQVAGYDFRVAPFATTASDHQFATLRVFIDGVFRTVVGMVADDPTSFQQLGPRPASQAGRVWAEVSNAGARQPNLDLRPEALAANETLAGSKAGTLSEGELDLLEWYLLNQPAPAQAAQNDVTRRGRALLDQLQCTSCHTADWALPPADPDRGFAGDRRFFDLEVTPNPSTGRLEGRLHRLTREAPGPHGTTLQVPRREGFTVRGLYADFRHHDLGERFHEHHHYNGRTFVLKLFRTAPLWGVGSTAPYGHDGRSMTLDDVIRRHGGEAEASAKAFAGASLEDREALIAFLKTLVLYQPDMLPTDLDGDGRIVADYRLGESPVGPERFLPELLFRVSPVYRGWVEDPDEGRYFSYELLNVAAAYGEELEALVDRDRDGVPDLRPGPAR
jgi:cytochrome c551/c552